MKKRFLFPSFYCCVRAIFRLFNFTRLLLLLRHPQSWLGLNWLLLLAILMAYSRLPDFVCEEHQIARTPKREQNE